MSHNETDNIAPGATDLFDKLRHEHSDQEQPPQNIRQQKESDEGESNLALDNVVDDNFAPENGKLPPEARRALVSLLRHGVILSAQKSRLFDCVCRYQSAIRSHLADVYLKLVLDEKAGVVFIAQLDEPDETDDEAVSLITRRVLSLYDTLLLLVLRKHYQKRESSGEQRIIIDIERIEANLSPFLPLTNSTKSDRRKLNAALQKMIEKRILSSIRGSDDRFEITPVIRYVVSAEFLEQMLEEYLRLGREAGVNMAVNSDEENAQGKVGE